MFYHRVVKKKRWIYKQEHIKLLYLNKSGKLFLIIHMLLTSFENIFHLFEVEAKPSKEAGLLLSIDKTNSKRS